MTSIWRHQVFKDSIGEDIVVYKRRGGISDSQVSSPKNLTKYMEIKNNFSDYFAGLDREALFVISETGPDGVLKIYVLNRIKKVFESAYVDGSLKIVHNDYLQLDKLLPTAVHHLNSSEAKDYPKVQTWLDQGGSAGWFVPVRISLATYSRNRVPVNAGPVKCSSPNVFGRSHLLRTHDKDHISRFSSQIKECNKSNLEALTFNEHS